MVKIHRHSDPWIFHKSLYCGIGKIGIYFSQCNWCFHAAYLISTYGVNILISVDSCNPQCAGIIGSWVPTRGSRVGHDARRMGIPWRRDISGNYLLARVLNSLHRQQRNSTLWLSRKLISEIRTSKKMRIVSTSFFFFCVLIEKL